MAPVYLRVGASGNPGAVKAFSRPKLVVDESLDSGRRILFPNFQDPHRHIGIGEHQHDGAGGFIFGVRQNTKIVAKFDALLSLLVGKSSALLIPELLKQSIAFALTHDDMAGRPIVQILGQLLDTEFEFGAGLFQFPFRNHPCREER